MNATTRLFEHQRNGTPTLIRVLSTSCDDPFDAVAVITRELRFGLCINQRVQGEVADVRERIKLIMLGGFVLHPRRRADHLRVSFGVGKIGPFASRFE